MKKVISLLTAAVMAFGLVACSGGSKEAASEASSAAASGSEAAEKGEAAEESVELNVLMLHVIGSIEDSNKVEAAINEYIEPLINATVKFEWMDLGDYVGQINIKLQSGDVIDILPNFSMLMPGMYASEAIMPLDDLIAQYGDGIVETLGEDYLNCGKINGVQYSIPITTAFAQNSAFIYREDIAEELGLDFSNVKTLEDMEPIFEQVQAAYPELTMICCNSFTDPQLREYDWDGLGDEYGVIMDAVNSTEVVDLYETDEYMDYCKLMNDWYNKGYVQSDCATCTEQLTTLLDSGLYFGTIAKDWPGNVEEKFSTSKYMIRAVELTDPVSTTTLVTNNVMTIPSTSQHPEKAMEFLNLIYTDEKLQNLISYGIEGEHYQLIDGNVAYLDGENIMTAKYVSKFAIGNSLLAYNEVTDPENINEIIVQWNDESDKSKALGFSYDSSSVANELTAIANVCAKYRRGLEAGSLDPETEIPKFISELKSAGIDKVVETKQEQLDAWLAEQ